MKTHSPQSSFVLSSLRLIAIQLSLLAFCNDPDDASFVVDIVIHSAASQQLRYRPVILVILGCQAWTLGVKFTLQGEYALVGPEEQALHGCGIISSNIFCGLKVKVKIKAQGGYGVHGANSSS